MKYLILVGCVLAVGCGGSSPNNPSATPVIPQVAQCVSSNTATVTFQNREVSETIDLVFDGTKFTTLSPGATSSPKTVVAGIQHSVEWKLTNSNLHTCSTSAPSFVQCTNVAMWCPG